jgi:hypothetical protein
MLRMVRAYDILSANTVESVILVTHARKRLMYLHVVCLWYMRYVPIKCTVVYGHLFCSMYVYRVIQYCLS